MLPKFQPADPVGSKDFGLLQTTWSALIDPILDRLQNRSNLLLVDTSVNPPNQKGYLLTIGDNVIYHKLGKKLTGWKIIGQDAAAMIYDKQASNPTTDTTLILNSSASCNIKLEVF